MFDHLDHELMRQPATTYRSMRAAGSVVASSQYGGFLAVCRHADVRDAARDASVFSSRAISIPGGPGNSIPTMSDPPEHAPLRADLDAMFTADRTTVVERQVRAHADRLLGEVAGRGAADFAAELSQPLVTAMLGDLIGLPPCARDRFEALVDTLIFRSDVDHGDGRRATYELHALLSRLAADAPPSCLADRQPVETVANMLLTLVYAAAAPTAFLISGALHLLATDEHRSTRQRLTTDPSLIHGAADEFARYLSPVQSIGRAVAHDAERFGHQFHAGTRVLLLWGSANRDDREFTDPDELQIARRPNRHVAFGAGAHRCPGAGLARSTFVAALSGVLARMPDYTLASDEVGWKIGHTCGINRLSVSFSPS